MCVYTQQTQIHKPLSRGKKITGRTKSVLGQPSQNHSTAEADRVHLVQPQPQQAPPEQGAQPHGQAAAGDVPEQPPKLWAACASAFPHREVPQAPQHLRGPT